MAKTQDRSTGGDGAASDPEPDPDLLAAVVLHILVTEGRDGLPTEAIALACERDPSEEAERAEVQRALEILVADELALRGGHQAADRPLFSPTRAAVRAAELNF